MIIVTVAACVVSFVAGIVVGAKAMDKEGRERRGE